MFYSFYGKLMVHFAQIDDDNIVVRVMMIDSVHLHRGQDFLANDLGLGGRWIRCSHSGKIRRHYPGTGYLYLPEPDIFIPPSPYPSWKLDANYEWQPPIPKPEGMYRWDELARSWIKLQPIKSTSKQALKSKQLAVRIVTIATKK